MPLQAESWAFAVDSVALGLLMSKGIFWTRNCKVCRSEEGIVVGSEYGLSKVLLQAGHNLATLMSRYAAIEGPHVGCAGTPSTQAVSVWSAC